MAQLLQGNNFVSLIGPSAAYIFDNESQNGSYLEYPQVRKSKQNEEKDKLTDETVNISEEESEEHTLPIVETVTNNPVLCACISDCGKFLSTSDEEKRIIIWEYCASWQILNIRSVVRKSIKLKFTHSSKYLLAADRGGDVCQFSVADQNCSGKLILGHLSMLLDIIITTDDKYVITCDRDEKIRVSNFPNCYNIHTYCLGHTKFVSTLAFCGEKSEYLLSGSGDGTIRMWNYLDGEQLSLLDYSVNFENLHEGQNQNCPAIKSMVTCGNLIAATFDSINSCTVFQCSIREGQHSLEFVYDISLDSEPLSILFVSPYRLLLLKSNETEALQVYGAILSNGKSKYEIISEESENESLTLRFFSKEVNKSWNKFKDSLNIKLNTSILYKQWFDNVEVYQEKKKQRVEEKKWKKMKC